MKLNCGLVLLPALVKSAKGTLSRGDASAPELLDRIINAMGGLESLGEIEGLTLQSS